MMILGVVLFAIGYFAPLHILEVAGVVLFVVGAVVMLIGRSGNAVGGRNWY